MARDSLVGAIAGVGMLALVSVSEAIKWAIGETGETVAATTIGVVTSGIIKRRYFD